MERRRNRQTENTGLENDGGYCTARMQTQERESFIFNNTAKHKRNNINITITTAVWRVARKANQPIRAGNPLSYTPIQFITRSGARVHSAKNPVALS